ncbi:GNAT family N-acetyltransferase [Streptococcus himalayensis]|uniref:N-acetyltransferase n=1 Tax=Streptococcus himalayensis TaxID=1888195 RepID=A0A917EFF3_9STRE|nr:GNAT family N-acetyltransferase [Streptococcus himalayensis]GGE27560.1 N-acetyltransferase [Streptococcus himalayensis]
MENIYLLLAENRILETERLILRPVTLEDAGDMYAYASDEETTRYVFPQNHSLEETKANIAGIYLATPLGRWGIVLKETGAFIGSIDMHKLDTTMRKSALGYCLHKDCWNNGYMTEAVKAVIQLAFETLEMNALVAVHDKENPASGRVMEKAGMHFSHEEPYAKMDGDRIVTRMYYRLTKEHYFGK